MANLFVCYNPDKVREGADLGACVEKWGAIHAIEHYFWIVKTDKPSKEVFEDFAKCFQPDAPLFVGAISEGHRQNIWAKADQLLY